MKHRNNKIYSSPLHTQKMVCMERLNMVSYSKCIRAANLKIYFMRAACGG